MEANDDAMPVYEEWREKWNKSTSSLMEGATKRGGHIAVVWKDATIIWGGLNRDSAHYICPSLVHYHIAGEWFVKETTGCLPKDGPYQNVAAQVLNDKLFIFGYTGCKFFQPDDHNKIIHALDLNKWLWTRHTPSGPPPLKGSNEMCSWVYNGKVYFFSGETVLNHEPKEGEHDYPSYLRVEKYPYNEDLYTNTTNQLFCYNPRNNAWEWPLVRGDIPSPRMEGTAIINGDLVYFFGGNKPHFETVTQDRFPRCDLYILDMRTMIWQLVHTDAHLKDDASKMSDGSFPIFKWQISHTLTRISHRTAVLFGSYHIYDSYCDGDDESFGFCWLLDLDEALHSNDPSSMWTQVPGYEHFKGHAHASVLEPLSQQLWVIGGFFMPTVGPTEVSGLLRFSPNVKPLKVLAMESTIRDISAEDPRVGSEELPEKLRKEIEWNRKVDDNSYPWKTGILIRSKKFAGAKKGRNSLVN